MDNFITNLGITEEAIKSFIPYLNWTLAVFVLIFLLVLWFKFFRNSSFIIFIEFIFEKIYEFFEDILWKNEKRWVKVYVTTMFFVIFTSNLLWATLEVLTPIFLHEVNGSLHNSLEDYIRIPTSDINFNIAMAIIWVLVVIYEQFRFLWVLKALYEYLPVLWKNYIPFERWNLPKIIEIPLLILVKIFDVTISLFLWLLEIIWHLAKIISLSFRLFWNVTSWGLLLAMLVAALVSLTTPIFGHGGFPIIGPVLIHFQWLLVALIQALVFPLLIAIFVKVAKTH